MEKMTLGRRIAVLRKKCGMTQEDLADALYIKKSTVSYYENDAVDIKHSRIEELARILGTTAVYLISGTEGEDEFTIEAMQIFAMVKSESIKEIMLEQMKALMKLDNAG